MDGTEDKRDETDPIDPERRGAAILNDGVADIAEIFDAMESERIGTARRKLGKEMMDNPLASESFLAKEALSSLDMTICPQETLRLYCPFLEGDADEELFIMEIVLCRLCL